VTRQRRAVTAPRPEHGFLRRHAVKLVASALITLGIVYTADSGGLKLVPEGGDFSDVRFAALAVYAPFVFGMMWFRSVRWRFLLRGIVDVPKRRLFAVTNAGYLAILVLPFRIGELVRPYLLRTPPEMRAPGRPVLTMTATTSSVVVERVIDGTFLSLVLATVLLLVPTIDPLPERVIDLPLSVTHVRFMGFMMLAVFAAALATILVFYFARDWADRVTRASLGRVSPRLADKIAGTANKVVDGLHVFRRGRDLLGLLAETTAYWTCNVVGMWLLAIGCGVVHADGSAITLPETCALLGMLGCTVLIPGPPGLLGVFQAGLYAGMTMYFPTEIVIGPGAAFVFLLYISQVILTTAVGLWGLYHEGGARRLRGAFDGSKMAETTEPR
jgi:glycosyltransferase 2 family protein